MRTEERFFKKSERKRQGAKAKAYGDWFEQIFERSCRSFKIAITRFPNGCKSVGARRIIRVKTPFDWIISIQGQIALIDTKTSSTNAFAHSKITDHQVHEMIDHEKNGILTGYVIWLRSENQVIFIKSGDLIKKMRTRGSITCTSSEIIKLGSINNFNPHLIFSKLEIENSHGS